MRFSYTEEILRDTETLDFSEESTTQRLRRERQKREEAERNALGQAFRAARTFFGL